MDNSRIKKGSMMDKIILFISVIVLFLLGCGEESIISTNPIETKTSYKLIKLPVPSKLKVNSIYSDSKQIDGSIGGFLSINESYSGGPFGTVEINSTLVFPAGCFNGIKTISMTADDEYCASSFQPGMSFSKPGVYNISYSGVDLNGIDPSTVKFVYLKSNGSLEYPEHEGIKVDYSTGKIEVKNAKLNHFSRYGFVN